MIGWRICRAPLHVLGAALAAMLLALLGVPLVALVAASNPADVVAGMRDPQFASALGLSVRTTLVSLAAVVLLGTPVAWWLACGTSRARDAVALLIELPIVLPPAVVGFALLQAFGRRGLFGPALEVLDVSLPFTEAAVVVAQIVVSAPFFVQAAANGFRTVDVDLLIVARTLGASPAEAFFRVAVPVALPGLVVGASLAWARALGEFGATLLFAGNLAGTTRTMPLAIFTALESDVRVALAFSLVLVGIGALLLLGLRVLPRALHRSAP